VAVPDTIRILVDFAGTDVAEPDVYARFEVDIENGFDGYNFGGSVIGDDGNLVTYDGKRKPTWASK
jgi:hypothetical protein